MDTYRSPARIADGKLDIDRDRFKAALASMGDGPVVLTVDRKKPKRSVEANNFYFGVIVKAICVETGQDKESVHEALKRECNAQHVEMVNKATGEVYEMWVGGSTAGLNVGEYSAYVERCRAWAGQFLGIVIDPDAVN